MDSKETFSSGLFGTLPSALHDDDNEPIGLCSAKASPLTGLSMESYMQNFHHQQLTKGLMSPQPSPPPVAMSLRTRESSALALKHIFDQQISNSASSREQRQQMGGFEGIRNQSTPDLRKRLPDLDLTFKKAQDSNLPYAQVGFGSPISTTTNQSSLLQAALPPINGQLMQHNYLPQAAASARLNPSSRQSTAQMTIFYSGNVNVYDDVPADKAQAIMLLAGNSWSSSFKCPAPPASAAPVSPAETKMMREGVSSPVKATPSQHASVTSTYDKGGSIAKSFGSPAPAAASLASPPPSPALQAPSPVADGIKSSQTGASQTGAAARKPHAGIELPHARKASLARFLEKRKDRVQVQQQDQQGGAASEKGGGEPTASCNDNPDHGVTSSSSKKRSRSPSPSRSNCKEKAANNNFTDEILSVNEHRFFH